MRNISNFIKVIYMRIGIVVAIFTEMQTLLENMHYESRIEEVPGFKVVIYKIDNKEVFVCESKAGEIAATQAAQYLITKYNVELILNFGICGGLKKELEMSKCALVTKVVHYDIDTEAIDGCKPGRYYYLDDTFIRPSEKILNLVRSLNLNLKEVTCASGDKFIADTNVKDKLVKDFDADICEMEIAGIALTCIRNKIDFISIKAISDSYHGGADEYLHMQKDASEIAFKILKEIIQKL